MRIFPIGIGYADIHFYLTPNFTKFHVMNKLLITTVLLAVLAASCQQPEKTAAAPAAPVATPAPAQPAIAKAKFPVNCFEQRLPDGSVLSFHYTEYYDQIVGILDYTFAEKDGAHGTLKGTKEGDIITALWSYTVEGSDQQEEVIFKITGDKAAKGSGELTETKSGVLKLKDPAKVDWTAEVFTRVNCD